MSDQKRDPGPDMLPNPKRAGSSEVTRREFLTVLSAATGALLIGGCGDSSSSADNPETAPLPAPQDSGIEHIVVVMMENRSFDHFLGWLPGADGKQAGLSYRDKQGVDHSTYSLAPNFQNCDLEDPDHSYDGGRAQFDGGATDGWLRAATNDLFPIGYYEQQDLSFFGPAVPAWTTADRYFCAILGPTYPNRFYMHAAQTDRLDNTFDVATIPTIWDRLAAAGVSASYFYSDYPILSLWGARYAPISKRIAEFYASAAAGTLPSVSYVDPRFVLDTNGTSGDDHPFADIRNGQAFLNQVYEALTSSPNWKSTVLIINYDEWGGFFDHVPPPLAPITDLDPVIGNDGRLGFRVPLLVASPLARRGFVAKRQYDHTSILRMIEWRYGLDPLTSRDASANNLAHVLDFAGGKALSAPRFAVPPGPFGTQCPAGSGSVAHVRPEIAGLGKLAAANGFPIGDR
jgi:phospholipase C